MCTYTCTMQHMYIHICVACIDTVYTTIICIHAYTDVHHEWDVCVVWILTWCVCGCMQVRGDGHGGWIHTAGGSVQYG